MAECLVDTERGRIFVRRWEPSRLSGKDSEALLLLHDSLGCVELWRDFPSGLANATGLAVIAYDRLGFGLSDPYPGVIQPDFIEAEVSSSIPFILRAMGAESFIAVGHSIGGAMAVATAARSCVCNAVVTVSSQAFVERRTVEGVRAARDMFARPDQMERLRRYHGEKAEWVLRSWTETWLDPAFAGWTLDAELKRVDCPLLAVHGSKDEYGSLKQAHRIVEKTAGRSELRVFAGCGHTPTERTLASSRKL